MIHQVAVPLVTFCVLQHLLSAEAMMENLVAHAFSWLATLVDASTGAAIGLGVLLATVKTVRASFQSKNGLGPLMSEIRTTLGRWLAFALELALAADILRTVMVPTWDEIGKLGAIVVLRTVLNYFLQREIDEEHGKSGGSFSGAGGPVTS